MQKWLLVILLACLFIKCASSSAPLDSPSLIENEIAQLKNVPLPFTLVYGGIQIRNFEQLLKNSGFSHISFGATYSSIRSEVPPQARAVLWTGIAKGDKDSPWGTIKSPWNNDLNSFQSGWTRRLASYSKSYGETTPVPAVDFFVLNIEAELRASEIFSQLKDSSLPTRLKSLSKSDFTQRYIADMQQLSALPVRFLKTNSGSFTTRFASYGDAPIPRDWFGIPKHSWGDWQSNIDRTNYLGNEGPGVNNPFTDELNVLTPSAYYFYPRGENLAYLLFQIEANRARSNKEMVVFITPRLVSKKYSGQPISEKLAEATAIFPFFSGANGLWLWEKSSDRNKKNDPEVFPAYQGFFKGLERLGNYKDFFEGNYKLHIPVSAHAAFSDKLVVWRGVVKNGRILIVAQNPYASPGEVTRIRVNYQSWDHTVTLTGKDIFLDDFKL